VKPPIFSCFGDIALATCEIFEKYLPYAMLMLQEAAELLVVLDQNDEDMVDYGNQLRCGIFETYSAILQGMKGAKAQLMSDDTLCRPSIASSPKLSTKIVAGARHFCSLICYIGDRSCSLTSCVCVLLSGIRG
jgi:hypothetical protein